MKIVALPPKPEPAAPWTPLELLTEFTEKVRDGRIVASNLMVFYVEREPDGTLRPHYWVANVSTAEQIAYGELMKQMALDDWRNP